MGSFDSVEYLFVIDFLSDALYLNDCYGYVPRYGCQTSLPFPFRSHPQGRRAREDRWCQAPIHQATPHQGPQIPPSSPRVQGYWQEDLFRKQTIDFLLSGLAGAGWVISYLAWVGIWCCTA